MHASAGCAEVSLVSMINKITNAQRVAALLGFDYPLKTRDGSKYPVIKFINHTHIVEKPLTLLNPLFTKGGREELVGVDSGVGWLFIYSLFPNKDLDGLAHPGTGMSLPGSSRVGEQRQTPCPALGDQGAQKSLLLLACLWVIPRTAGLSCRSKGSAGRAGAETSVLNTARAD